jgi:outer membrane protein assembly factor BamB
MPWFSALLHDSRNSFIALVCGPRTGLFPLVRFSHNKPFHIFEKNTMRQKNALFIFSRGRVAAIDKKTGEIIWEVKIKDYLNRNASFYYGQIVVEDNKVFVGTTGILLCLNAKDGSLIWKNELKGWGYQFVSMANAGNDASAAASASAATAAAVITAST